MVRPDWDAKEFSLPEPGWYHVQVSNAELKQGPKSMYFSIRLGEIDSNRGIAFDNIMVTGGGAGIGVSKMKALGIVPGSEVEPHDLDGMRAWVYIVWGKYTGKDGNPKTKTVVDTRATGTHCGYLSEDEYKEKQSTLAPIDGWKKDPNEQGSQDETPF